MKPVLFKVMFKVKFKNAPIRLKLGGGKPKHRWKNQCCSRSCSRSNVKMLVSGSNLVEVKLNMGAV